MKSEHLVSTEWLADHLGDPELRIVDMRGHLSWESRGYGAPWKSGRADYEKGHVPGAVHLDFATDLVNTDDPIPLQVAPSKALARVFGSTGIGDSHTVIAYDSDRSVFATRLWWIFRLCGHTNVRVLDGGWPKWSREGRPVSRNVPEFQAAVFTADSRPRHRVQIEAVLEAMKGSGATLVDARAPRDYMGEPKWAERGGHIPGALNLPAANLLGTDGTFRPAEEIRAIVEEARLPRQGDIITYCGLGLSATALAFALDILAYPCVSVYDGSWAEWGGRSDLPAE